MLRGRSTDESIAQLAVAHELFRYRWMQIHMPRLAELRLPDRQPVLSGIKVATEQLQCFGTAQASSGIQPEECLKFCWPQRPFWWQHSCDRKEVCNLLIRIYVRRKSAVCRTEHIEGGNEGLGLLPGAELGEGSNNLHSPRPGYRSGTGGLTLRPVDNELQSKRPFVADLICEARKRQEPRADGAKCITEPPTFIEIFLCSALHGVVRRHAALPGQGSATAANRFVSTLV